MQTGTKTTAVEQKQSHTEMNCKISQLQSEMRTKIEEVKLLFPSLSRQLQQEATERDKKTALLQRQEMTSLKQVQAEMKQVQAEMNRKISQLQTEMNRKMTFIQSEVETSIEGLKQVLEGVNKSVREQLRQSSGHVQEAQTPVEQQAASNYGCEVFTFARYSHYKGSNYAVDSVPFYTHHHGYKFKLRMLYYPSTHNYIGASLYLMKGEYDSQLKWPLKVKVQLDLLNQAGNHHHVFRKADLR
jgi:phage host-nuclease inhibitor protein Gam